MKPKKLSICLFSYRKSYYLTHPLEFLRELWIGAKNLYHRARYGYAYVDAWNMNSAWCEMGANMMLHLAQHGCAYPGDGEFDTPEKWRAHLEEMARRLRECAKLDWNWSEQKNEYEDALMADLNNEELKKKWLARQVELEQERQAFIKETFEIIGKNFDLYWD